MRIAYCTPGLGACGGVRIILEHCIRLKSRGHDVTIINPSGNSPTLWEWYGPHDVPIVRNVQLQDNDFDVVVATGASTVSWAKRVQAAHYFYFVQMMEHRFNLPDTQGFLRSKQSYTLAKDQGMTVITIADWLQEELERSFGIEADIIPNGVNQEHFYPDGKKQNYILVEGDSRNQAKDIDGISWTVAEELRDEYDVALYGYAGLEHEHASTFDEFFVQPPVDQMRELYSRALFLLKASRLEGRACAPVEAMCCGTTTVRGIIKGDDDLIHKQNCLRGDYDLAEVTELATRLIESDKLRHKLEKGCKQYAKSDLKWDKIIDRLEELYRV